MSALRQRRRTAGFTLLELLVATAIAAMLAMLATAGYTHTVRRAQRLDARAALLTIAAAQERHYLEHARYAARLAGPAVGAPPDPGTNAREIMLPYPDRSPDGHYALELATGDEALDYTAIATARGAQAADRTCSTYKLDSTGRRAAADASGRDTTAECWK